MSKTMSIFNDMLRPFWLPGLNAVSGKVTINLKDWINNKNFQIYHSLTRDSFVLSVYETKSLLSAFAFDHNRMSIAALESIFLVEKSKVFPKSLSWLFIKTYYAAFYAAHAILRMLGTSLTYLGAAEASSINTIGDLYGVATEKIASGFYRCTFDYRNNTFVGKKFTSNSGGSHIILWKVFYEFLDDLSNRILIGPGITLYKQNVVNKLWDINRNLSYGPCSGDKSWLSFIRNGITYRHEYSVWFPYKNQLVYYERLYDLVNTWKKDPLEIDIYNMRGKDLKRFLETCCSLVSIMRIMDLDMSNRCPNGKSFLQYGPMNLLNLAGLNS